eukprot:768817-Hanusia_phi.AAC.9
MSKPQADPCPEAQENDPVQDLPHNPDELLVPVAGRQLIKGLAVVPRIGHQGRRHPLHAGPESRAADHPPEEAGDPRGVQMQRMLPWRHHRPQWRREHEQPAQSLLVGGLHNTVAHPCLVNGTLYPTPAAGIQQNLLELRAARRDELQGRVLCNVEVAAPPHTAVQEARKRKIPRLRLPECIREQPWPRERGSRRQQPRLDSKEHEQLREDAPESEASKHNPPRLWQSPERALQNPPIFGVDEIPQKPGDAREDLRIPGRTGEPGHRLKQDQKRVSRYTANCPMPVTDLGQRDSLQRVAAPHSKGKQAIPLRGIEERHANAAVIPLNCLWHIDRRVSLRVSQVQGGLPADRHHPR